MLAAARRHADALLAEAQREAELLRQEAREAGLRTGRAEGAIKGREEGLKVGRDLALGEHRAQLSHLISSLAGAAADLDASRRALEDAALSDVIELSIAIAERVTKRQGVLDPAVAVANVREALRLVMHAADVRIALNPDQRGELEAVMPAIRAEWPAMTHVEIVDDLSIAKGGCRIQTRGGRIDADLDAQLTRIAAELLPASTDDAS